MQFGSLNRTTDRVNSHARYRDGTVSAPWIQTGWPAAAGPVPIEAWHRYFLGRASSRLRYTARFSGTGRRWCTDCAPAIR